LTVSLSIPGNPIGVTASWVLNMSKSGEISGTLNQRWLYGGLNGEGRVAANVFNVHRTTAVTPTAIVPLTLETLDDYLQAIAR